MAKKKGLLLVSGGVDSIVLMYELARTKKVGAAAFADYGQIDADYCWGLIKYHGRKSGVRVHRLKVPLPPESIRGDLKQKGFVPPKRPMTYKWDVGKKSKKELYDFLENEFLWIDGRNIFILATAAIYAVHNGMDKVYTGYQFDQHVWDEFEKHNLGDSTPGFVEAMNVALAHAVVRDVTIECPFLDEQRTKTEIIALGTWLGVDMTRTYSCDFFPACGTCHNCQLLPSLGIRQRTVK